MPLGISQKCAAIAPSATFAIDAKARALREEGIDVIAFAAGEPDFPAPDAVRCAMKEAMDLGLTHYAPVSGSPELKEAVSFWLQNECNAFYPVEQIIISNGAKHSLYTLFQALLNPGDEVIIPTPCWVSYPEMVRMAGGTPVFVQGQEENGFIPSQEEIAAAVTPRTKAFVLTNPSNPCGCVWPEERLLALGRLAVERGFYLVSDEIYGKLVYDGKKSTCLATLGEDIKAQTILINGVSKSFAMTGFRIGFAAGPRDIIRAMTTYQSHSTSAPNAAAMFAAAKAFRLPPEVTEEMRRTFEERRNRLTELVNAVPGLSCRKPEGAFYVMMNHKGLIGKSIGGDKITDSASFAEILLKHAHVAVVPGNAFMAEGYCRLSYAVSMKKIEEGLLRIATFAKELQDD